MRGEHSLEDVVDSAGPGSSPHARGARHVAPGADSRAGIIPACAGSTACEPRPCAGTWDHPRMRGEHVDAALTVSPLTGSSPHARGARRSASKVPCPCRIIPACVGSTRRHRAGSTHNRDHPRMRGEHATEGDSADELPGSSPHARGAHVISLTPCSKTRIIPACAGSTSYRLFCRYVARDHPRMRGEHRAPRAGRRPRRGSSPHARGAPRVIYVSRARLGIIPACAGSTHNGRSLKTNTWDHPRMRGEHALHASEMPCSMGSSPHARGAPAGPQGLYISAGIIPACAGSTSPAWPTTFARRDHPRMRGEHWEEPSSSPLPSGSSPHARGALRHRHAHARRQGIIPACAGSTSPS